ncbi:hypothetical protein [Benzoatithermus flavus]|uniref:PEP-CTERM protein-sorting domain-containing protein n=1 Tax=Benzoatithermus flavus TaxID=3108223 RepID=A0ABU8XZZ3_9PROT
MIRPDRRLVAALRAALTVLVLAAAAPVRAAAIDWTRLPGGVADDRAIGPEDLIGQGVVLRWRNRGDRPFGDAALERAGPDQVSAFLNRHAATYDTANGGTLPPYFLRAGDDFRATGQGAALVLELARPTAFASGRIWDIDGRRGHTEQWRITAFDTAGTTLASVMSPLGDSQVGDGLPWTWVLGEAGEGTAAHIARIEITFVGSKRQGVGVGFDGFETGLAVTPLPATGFLLAPALAGLSLLAARARRREPRPADRIGSWLPSRRRDGRPASSPDPVDLP